MGIHGVLDGDVTDGDPAQVLGKIGDLTQAAYTLLHVVELFVLPGDTPAPHALHLDAQMTQEIQAERQRYLDDLAQRLRASGCQVHTRTLLAAQPAVAILDAVQTHGQNTENAPIEETEANYPVRIVRYELINDSEGAGRWLFYIVRRLLVAGRCSCLIEGRLDR